jgi:hypothetical protein
VKNQPAQALQVQPSLSIDVCGIDVTFVVFD